MSNINPTYQEFFDLPDGLTIGITRCKIVETNNTIPVTPGQYNPEGSAGLQLKDTNDLSQTGWFYLSTAGNIGINNVSASRINQDATFITLHKLSNGVA